MVLIVPLELALKAEAERANDIVVGDAAAVYLLKFMPDA